MNTEVGQNPGQGFVWTPDKLLRVEILEDKTQTVPIAFHHVHFYIADTAGSSQCARDAIVVREDVRRQGWETRPI